MRPNLNRMNPRRRLDPQLLRVDPRVREGYYSDEYFNRSRYILLRDDYHPTIRMQVFQKHDDVCLCGVSEALGILYSALGEDFGKLEIHTLRDGDIIERGETVMIVEGDYSLFAHLETVYLGALSRRTRVATNVYRTVREASRVTPKPVLFFPARFDIYQCQAGDGFAYDIALGTLGIDSHSAGYGVSTPAQGDWWGSRALGTIPHGLQAAYGGDIVLSSLKFAEYLDPDIKRIVLVDFHNDSVGTTLDVADAFLQRYLPDRDPRYQLYAVRLDTSETVIDRSICKQMELFKPTGVNPQLVINVHQALQERAAGYPAGSVESEFYKNVGIVCSGGFTPEKIARFERLNLPVIAYGVGSSMFSGQYDFTADVVSLKQDDAWRDVAKVGRRHRPNDRLELVRY
ncbi:MAG TPA: quinolinate phosphoribosyl transferase [Acidobacteriota bacterium]|nr:quinolinate phosphoribosyl transferase [Acidobacteriota bacterium]